MTDDQIEKILLKNGFKRKRQENGTVALNPYVFKAARELIGQGIRLAYTETRESMQEGSPKWLCRVQKLEDYAIQVESK